MIFTSPSNGQLTLDQVIEIMKQYFQEDQAVKYKIIIGSDSQSRKESTIFVSAILIHKIGKGSRFFYQKVVDKPNQSLSERIYKETAMSLQLVDLLRERKLECIIDCPIEIHLDIGHGGESRKLIKELVAWVSSIGYEVKIKPHSYGASSVADRFTS